MDKAIIKTFSWRLLATLDTFLITWLITGSLLIGGSVVSLEVLTKTVLYYLHEKGWDKWSNG